MVYCQSGKIAQAAISRFRFGGQSCRQRMPMELNYLVSSLFRGQSGMVWPKIHAVNHIISQSVKGQSFLGNLQNISSSFSSSSHRPFVVQSPSHVWLFATHGLQHTRLPCPSPSPKVCSNSCLLSQWYHPTISSSVTPFFSCLQSFPASESFPVSQLFASGGQSTRASASASVLPVNIQGWFPLGLTGWCPCCPRDTDHNGINLKINSRKIFGQSLSV